MTEPPALKQGRQRYQATRRSQAIERVRAYREWCRSGGDLRSMPPVPRSWEFKVARGVGE